MIYLQKSKNKRSSKFLLLPAVLIVILILDFSGVLKKTLETLSVSVWQNAESFNSFTLHFFESFKDKQALILENEELKNAILDFLDSDDFFTQKERGRSSVDYVINLAKEFNQDLDEYDLVDLSKSMLEQLSQELVNKETIERAQNLLDEFEYQYPMT